MCVCACVCVACPCGDPVEHSNSLRCSTVRTVFWLRLFQGFRVFFQVTHLGVSQRAGRPGEKEGGWILTLDTTLMWCNPHPPSTRTHTPLASFSKNQPFLLTLELVPDTFRRPPPWDVFQLEGFSHQTFHTLVSICTYTVGPSGFCVVTGLLELMGRTLCCRRPMGTQDKVSYLPGVVLMVAGQILGGPMVLCSMCPHRALWLIEGAGLHRATSSLCECVRETARKRRPTRRRGSFGRF